MGHQAIDNKNTTPTMGGLIIISSIVISTLLWSDLSNHYILVIIWDSCFGLIGFYDDYKKLIEGKSDGIKGRLKLFFQIISASLITIYLYVFMDTGDTSSVMPFLKDNSIYLGILYTLVYFYSCWCIKCSESN